MPRALSTNQLMDGVESCEVGATRYYINRQHPRFFINTCKHYKHVFPVGTCIYLHVIYTYSYSMDLTNLVGVLLF